MSTSDKRRLTVSFDGRNIFDGLIDIFDATDHASGKFELKATYDPAAIQAHTTQCERPVVGSEYGID